MKALTSASADDLLLGEPGGRRAVMAVFGGGLAGLVHAARCLTPLPRRITGRAAPGHSVRPENGQEHGDPERQRDQVEDVDSVTADPDPRAAGG